MSRLLKSVLHHKHFYDRRRTRNKEHDRDVQRIQTPRNRREELEQYFAKKMGWTDKGMHFKLLHLSLKDLEYVRSDCDAAEREGRCAWAAAFRTATGFNKKYQLSTDGR